MKKRRTDENIIIDKILTVRGVVEKYERRYSDVRMSRDVAIMAQHKYDKEWEIEEHYIRSIYGDKVKRGLMAFEHPDHVMLIYSGCVFEMSTDWDINSYYNELYNLNYKIKERVKNGTN